MFKITVCVKTDPVTTAALKKALLNKQSHFFFFK